MGKVYYPLLVTHLCLCDKDFFLSNMMNLLDMLFKVMPTGESEK